MADLIDREWLLRTFHNRAFDKANTNTAYNELRWGIKVIKQAPSARPKGKWIEEPNCWYRCSICGSHEPSIKGFMDYNFCPNCGAEMRGEQDDQ